MKHFNHQILIVVSFLVFFFAAFTQNIRAQSSPLALDENFTAGVSGGAENVKAIAVAPDGAVLVGGDFQSVNGAARVALARFNSSGALDQSFNPPFSADAVIESILVQPDGKIIISGDFTASAGGRAVRELARLNPDGSFDAEFTAHLAGRYQASELAIQPDGKILGAGYSYTNDRVSCVFRLNPNGTPDAAFNPLLEYVNNLRSITVERDGKLLDGGTIRIGGQDRGGLVLLNPDGSVDSSFNPGGAGIAGNILQTIELENNQIYAAGEIDSYNGIARRGIVRLNSNGTLDQTFVSGFQTGGGARVNRLLMQPDGRILIGGLFQSYGGAARESAASEVEYRESDAV